MQIAPQFGGKARRTALIGLYVSLETILIVVAHRMGLRALSGPICSPASPVRWRDPSTSFSTVRVSGNGDDILERDSLRKRR